MHLLSLLKTQALTAFWPSPVKSAIDENNQDGIPALAMGTFNFCGLPAAFLWMYDLFIF